MPAEPTVRSDLEVIRAAADGDREALATLYDRYASVMLGLGIRILRNRREAEDIAHDVFLEVWRRAHSYDPSRASVRSWLLLMMRSRSLDRRKSAGFSWGVPLEHEPTDSNSSPEDALERRKVAAALAHLNEVQREVLLLGYYEGLSSTEIAEVLSLPVGTVKSRVAAALRALKMSLTRGNAERIDVEAPEENQ